MLDYNKIESCLNFRKNGRKELAVYLEMAPSTFYDKMKKENFNPNELEKIADFFNKPIGYFFDREEPAHQTNEPAGKYGNDCCKLCEEKDERIKALEGRLKDKEELLEMYRGKAEKENRAANSA